jgi:hypothetical protein
MGAVTPQKLNTDTFTANYLKKYKTILEATNAHLEGYEPGEGNSDLPRTYV